MPNEKWEMIRQNIERDDAGKKDYYVPIEHVRMNQKGNIGDARYKAGFENQIGLNNRGLSPNDHALSQLFGKVGIPAQYGKKCYDYDPIMIADHVNRWIKAGRINGEIAEDRQFLLRAKNDMCRAVLSDRFSQLDNNFVFGALDAGLRDGNIKVKDYDINDRSFHMRIIFPDLTTDVGTPQKPDRIQVGVHVVNSEVGFSSLRIESCLYRLVCSNGLIARVGGETLMCQRHIHLTQNEIQRRVVAALSSAIKQGDKAMEMFARSREIKVETPLEMIENLAKSQKYSKEFTDNVKNAWNNEPGEDVFSIINAFTDAAKSLPIDRRVEVETFAGEYMEKMVA